MAASATDKFMKVGKSTATTLSSPGYTVGNTSINVASTTNWPTDTGVMFAIDETDADGARVSGTYNVFRGTVASGTQIDNLVYVGGDANRNYSAGATTRVYILVSADRDNRLIDGILVEHNQDGTHGAITATTVTATGAITSSGSRISDENGLVSPVGAILDYAGATAPTGWLLCYGQTLDASTNTEYADLYAVIGNTYGGSDNTDFVVPDLRGRVVAGQDDMGGTSANRLTNQSGGVDGDVLGDTGGAETINLAHQHKLGIGSDASTAFFRRDGSGNPPYGSATGTGSHGVEPYDSTSSSTYREALSESKLSSATNNVQPTIILNKIIKY